VVPETAAQAASRRLVPREHLANAVTWLEDLAGVGSPTRAGG